MFGKIKTNQVLFTLKTVALVSSGPVLLMTILLTLSLSGCVTTSKTAQVPASGPLDGKWKLVDRVCFGGTNDKTVQLNHTNVTSGVTEDLLDIHGGNVHGHLVTWNDVKKTAACEIDSRQIWDISSTTYSLNKFEVSKTKTGGVACPEPPPAVMSGRPIPFQRKGDTLRIVLSDTKSAKAIPNATTVCTGGTWSAIYHRIQ